ncbi:MAG: hypothetical protein R3325_08575 [Thermoanaerobaculia bacterium]|nr:hypothetical protein [Thermoanaerobaculia bacterium]
MSPAAVAFFVSPHGYGHAARAAAVAEALVRRRPGLRPELFTSVPRWFFEDSLTAPFGWHRALTDVGLAQRSAVEEDLGATADRLAAFYPFARSTVARLARRVLELGCAAVVADISPLGIEVARRAGLPAVLVESFTWDWLYRAYPRAEPRLEAPADGFAECFAAATLRLQTEPLCRRVAGAPRLPPISRRPRSGRAAVAAALDLDPSRPLVVLHMGGFGWSWSEGEPAGDLRGAQIVAIGGVESPRREGRVLTLPHRPPVRMRDLTAAADLVVAKLGYSTVAEADASGTALLHPARPTSPEYPFLARYVAARLPSAEISVELLAGGGWRERAADLLAAPRPAPAVNGDEEAARAIDRLLG